jgi:hypothetical protein
MTTEDNRRKTLVDINLSIWATVKYFATIKKISINEALELLVERGLVAYGYSIKRKIAVSAGRSLAAASQQTSP